MSEPIRVLLAKPTHDCHDRGVRHVARKLRDAGFEVIFTNFLLPSEIVNTALEEDVAVKVLRAEAASEPDIARRFRSEIKLARRALSGLPTYLRTPVRLYYMQGKPLREVARTLRLTPNAVKARLYRARRLMRREAAR